MIAGIKASDRVAVLGARGWFGSTLLTQLPSGVSTFATASIPVKGYGTWSLTELQDFAPTVVANFAFLTRERVESEGMEVFTRTNEMLIEQFRQTAELPSVRAALTVSSGAAVTDPKSPYGGLKVLEEQTAASLPSPHRSVVTLRAYSVSGPEVRRPQAYAFSDFILQAHAGRVLIQAPHRVYRRYVSVHDALAVSLGSALLGWSGVIDTGGELIEMGDLAKRSVELVNPRAEIIRPRFDATVEQTYASDDVAWMTACARLGYVPLDLDDQIRVTAKGLLEHDEVKRGSDV